MDAGILMFVLVWRKRDRNHLEQKTVLFRIIPQPTLVIKESFDPEHDQICVKKHVELSSGLVVILGVSFNHL